MRSLVVYESLWGNTEKVARAIADRLDADGDVEVRDAESAPSSTDGFDLLVVGGPTHAFSMSRPRTRAEAVESRQAPREPVEGIREWLDRLAPPDTKIPAVAFDTRVAKPRLPGSAAKAARHELRSLGFDTEFKQRTFHVHGYEGPLVDGELDEAGRWAGEILSQVGSAAG
ncbi:flavodoxin family protein [Arthrobacter gandavensis]|uniref:flavodoxin family protein n=1 Tax=Arthrobacter gandavensis TaxID=169960 RepID=UPI001890623B|nr:flavodoxin domain-containing protein [Arthrobacter gandavensis]MBF4994387.1 flavodoxin family protein [Arthrobacter gandavensis]